MSEISARVSCGFTLVAGFFRLGSGSFSGEGFGVSFLLLADGLEGGNGAVGFSFYFVFLLLRNRRVSGNFRFNP